MVESIPTFRLTISEGGLDIEENADKLFGYCVEANKGPILTPTFCSTNEQVKKIFGLDFAPHFYQNPTGVVICRVGFPNAKSSSIAYQMTEKEATVPDSPETITILKVESVEKGTTPIVVNVTENALSAGTYNLYIKIPDVLEKTYNAIPSLFSVCKRLNSNYGTYIKATYDPDNKLATLSKEETDFDFVADSNNGALQGGSIGVYTNTQGEPTETPIPETGVDFGLRKPSYEEGDPNPDQTLYQAYKPAFEKMKEINLLGIATLSNAEVVQNLLIEHIEEMNDEEVAQLRFGVLGYIGEPGSANDFETLIEVPMICDNEYIIYIGQGVKFKDKDKEYELPAYKAVMLYTGIRSKLDYDDSIFGGEPKKVLSGVTDTLPLINSNEILVKSDLEYLNESGVCTFKKEYDNVTFLEGVTTCTSKDVLSYESIMSIVCYVTKRLIAASKPYMGQNLTEDLKASLESTLIAELKTIVQTDQSLIELSEYNMPPYSVEVSSNVLVKFDEVGELIRESKVIVKCKIIPVGALRMIDLGVIVI